MKFKFMNTAIVGLIMSTSVCSTVSNAGIIEITLGNGTSGLIDGSTYSGFDMLDLLNEVHPDPFDAVNGGFSTEPDNAYWQFDNLGAITDTIIGASISFGLWDLDSAASGSQLDSFALDQTNFTLDLNNLFEANGGSTYNEFNVFTIDLDSIFFANLADGLLDVDLDIGGNGYSKPVNEPIEEIGFNKYFLVYSTLIIETEDFAGPDPDPEPPVPVPEPSTLAIFALGFMGIGLRRFKK